MSSRPISRPLLLVFAVIFLFETWIWDKIVAGLSWIARRIPWERIKRASKNFINRMPAIFAVLLFGIPVVVMELGSFFSVIAIAFGHVILGAICYGALKLIGVSLIAVIYDLTREKLMTLPWFVWLHCRFERLHLIAHEYVAPYREAVLDWLHEARQRVAKGLGRWGLDLREWRRRAHEHKRGAFTPEREFD